MSSNNMTQYERKALEEIREWKSKDSVTLISKIKGSQGGKAIGSKIIRVKNAIGTTKPGQVIAEASLSVGKHASNTIAGVLQVLNDAASWSIHTDRIYTNFERKGLKVNNGADIHQLTLEQVDEVVGRFDTGYKIAAFLEGAGTGALGFAGIAADIPALFSLNLRGIASVCTFYGFNSDLISERNYILEVLNYSSNFSAGQKAIFQAQLRRIAIGVAKKQAWKKLEEDILVKAAREITLRFTQRQLTKAALGKMIPGISALVGAGTNSHYTAVTMDAAFHLYRERFLAAKYGFEILENHDT